MINFTFILFMCLVIPNTVLSVNTFNLTTSFRVYCSSVKTSQIFDGLNVLTTCNSGTYKYQINEVSSDLVTNTEKLDVPGRENKGFQIEVSSGNILVVAGQTTPSIHMREINPDFTISAEHSKTTFSFTNPFNSLVCVNTTSLCFSGEEDASPTPTVHFIKIDTASYSTPASAISEFTETSSIDWHIGEASKDQGAALIIVAGSDPTKLQILDLSVTTNLVTKTETSLTFSTPLLTLSHPKSRDYFIMGHTDKKLSKLNIATLVIEDTLTFGLDANTYDNYANGFLPVFDSIYMIVGSEDAGLMFGRHDRFLMLKQHAVPLTGNAHASLFKGTIVFANPIQTREKSYINKIAYIEFCHQSCLTCGDSYTYRDAADCTDCKPNYIITLGTDPVCTCPSGFFVDPINGNCDKCHINCESCTGSLSSCESCTANYNFDAVSSTCNCPDGFFIDPTGLCLPCDSSCLTCSGTATTCLSCSGQGISSDLVAGACVCRTSDNKFVVDSGGNCVACDSSCSTCSGSPTTCTSCTETYSLQAGKCVCEGATPFDFEGKCVCREDCGFIEIGGQCMSCQCNNQKDNQCVPGCKCQYQELDFELVNSLSQLDPEKVRIDIRFFNSNGVFEFLEQDIQPTFSNFSIYESTNNTLLMTTYIKGGSTLLLPRSSIGEDNLKFNGIPGDDRLLAIRNGSIFKLKKQKQSFSIPKIQEQTLQVLKGAGSIIGGVSKVGSSFSLFAGFFSLVCLPGRFGTILLKVKQTFYFLSRLRYQKTVQGVYLVMFLQVLADNLEAKSKNSQDYNYLHSKYSTGLFTYYRVSITCFDVYWMQFSLYLFSWFYCLILKVFLRCFKNSSGSRMISCLSFFQDIGSRIHFFALQVIIIEPLMFVVRTYMFYGFSKVEGSSSNLSVMIEHFLVRLILILIAYDLTCLIISALYPKGNKVEIFSSRKKSTLIPKIKIKAVEDGSADGGLPSTGIKPSGKGSKRNSKVFPANFGTINLDEQDQKLKSPEIEKVLLDKPEAKKEEAQIEPIKSKISPPNVKLDNKGYNLLVEPMNKKIKVESKSEIEYYLIANLKPEYEKDELMRFNNLGVLFRGIIYQTLLAAFPQEPFIASICFISYEIYYIFSKVHCFQSMDPYHSNLLFLFQIISSCLFVMVVGLFVLYSSLNTEMIDNLQFIMISFIVLALVLELIIGIYESILLFCSSIFSFYKKKNQSGHEGEEILNLLEQVKDYRLKDKKERKKLHKNAKGDASVNKKKSKKKRKLSGSSPLSEKNKLLIKKGKKSIKKKIENRVDDF